MEDIALNYRDPEGDLIRILDDEDCHSLGAREQTDGVKGQTARESISLGAAGHACQRSDRLQHRVLKRVNDAPRHLQIIAQRFLVYVVFKLKTVLVTKRDSLPNNI